MVVPIDRMDRCENASLMHTSPLTHHASATVDEANNFLILGFDTLVFLLTVLKIVRQVRTIRQLGIKQGLSYYLLRDGTIYYL